MNADGDEVQEILPKHVGGSRVHLLLGIKNTNLDPVLIKRLPSGIAVYRSLFKDVYGFSKVTNKILNNTKHPHPISKYDVFIPV